MSAIIVIISVLVCGHHIDVTLVLTASRVLL